MHGRLKRLFDKYQRKLGKISGQHCNILRPNYSTVDNTPATLHTGAMVKVEVTAPRLTQSHFINVHYYAIFGDRRQFQAGDIIQPTTSGSTTPPVTVLNVSPLEECIGIGTSRVGKLCLDIDTDVYTNVYFEWVGGGFPGSNYAEALAGALSIPQKKIVLYTRTNIKPHEVDYEIVGMHFIETDGDTETRWIVKMIDQIGNLTQLTLSQDR